MSDSTDVVVVGAGIAGLVCARELTRHGLRVTVVERDDGVGGRVRTDELDGFLLDRGFQVLPTSYPEVRRLLDVDRLDLHPFTSGAIVRHGGRFRRVADPRRSPLQGLRSLAGPVVSPRDASAATKLLKGRREEETIETALRASGLSEAARTSFAEPFLRGVTLEAPLETSSRFLTFVLRSFADGPAALPGRGMQAVPEQLADGVDVRLSTPVVAVGPRAVTLASGQTMDAAAVVVATAGLLDDAPAGWNGVQCLAFAASEPPLPGPWLVLNGAEPGPVNNLCVPSEVAPGYAPAGRALVTVSVLGSEPPDLELVVHQLRGWFGSAVGGWHHLRTTSVPRALPAYPPGTRFASEPKLADGLFACGDHREHPSLNGAMASGRRAARSVLASLER